MREGYREEAGSRGGKSRGAEQKGEQRTVVREQIRGSRWGAGAARGQGSGRREHDRRRQGQLGVEAADGGEGADPDSPGLTAGGGSIPWLRRRAAGARPAATEAPAPPRVPPTPIGEAVPLRLALKRA